MLRSALLTVVTTAGLGLGLLVPASAEPVTTVTVDTSRPGHVTGTVATGAAYAWVSVSGSAAPERVEGGELAYDLLTWGAPTDRESTLTVGSCADETPASCSTTQTAFTARDVDPGLTWSEDRSVGPGETATLTVADPDGGGTLHAVSSRQTFDPQVLTGGLNTLHLPDGTNEVTVSRCGDLGCRPVDTQTYLVDRYFSPHPIGAPSRVRPDATTAPDTSVGYVVEGAETYDVVWHLRDLTGTDLPGTSGRVDGLAPQGPVLRVPVDLTPAPEGRSVLVATISYDSEQFGHVATTTENPWVAEVDRTAPRLGEPLVTGRRLFPDSTHAAEELRVGVDTPAEEGTVRVDLVDPETGRSVHHQEQPLTGGFADLVWYGTTDGGGRAPAGRYRVRLTATDVAGNAAQVSAGHVTLDWRSVRRVVVHRTMTARRVEVDRWAGRCSRVVDGGSRGWQGGLGLASNTRCSSRTWPGSGVSVGYAVPLPRGWRDGRVRIDVLGGAALSRPGSTAAVQLRNRRQEWGFTDRLPPAATSHDGTWLETHPFEMTDGRLYWRTAAGYGNRYDVWSFEVHFRGSVLR